MGRKLSSFDKYAKLAKPKAKKKTKNTLPEYFSTSSIDVSGSTKADITKSARQADKVPGVKVDMGRVKKGIIKIR